MRMALLLFFILPILLACVSGYFISKKAYNVLTKNENKYAIAWSVFIGLASVFLIWIGLMAIIISQVRFER